MCSVWLDSDLEVRDSRLEILESFRFARSFRVWKFSNWTIQPIFCWWSPSRLMMLRNQRGAWWRFSNKAVVLTSVWLADMTITNKTVLLKPFMEWNNGSCPSFVRRYDRSAIIILSLFLKINFQFRCFNEDSSSRCRPIRHYAAAKRPNGSARDTCRRTM